MRFLVTAGPTREHIDPVRFLSNASSGRMGFAIAGAALDRGHAVRIIAGPVDIPPPPGAAVDRVVSAADMNEAVTRRFPEADVLVMAAAVADWTPVDVAKHKLAKGTATRVALELRRTPDVVAGAARGRGRRLVVGFALETHDRIEHALRKLREKDLDLIVADGAEVIGSADAAVTVLGPGGFRRDLGPAGKPEIARQLVTLIEEHAEARKPS